MPADAGGDAGRAHRRPDPRALRAGPPGRRRTPQPADAAGRGRPASSGASATRAACSRSACWRSRCAARCRSTRCRRGASASSASPCRHRPVGLHAGRCAARSTPTSTSAPPPRSGCCTASPAARTSSACCRRWRCRPPPRRSATSPASRIGTVAAMSGFAYGLGLIGGPDDAPRHRRWLLSASSAAGDRRRPGLDARLKARGAAAAPPRRSQPSQDQTLQVQASQERPAVPGGRGPGSASRRSTRRRRRPPRRRARRPRTARRRRGASRCR